MRVDRRDFLIGAAAGALSGRSAAAIRLDPQSIRVASNQGVENAALQQLMADRGFAGRMALDIATVPSNDIAGPIKALEAGEADLCMISAYAGVLPAIEAGQPIRLIGSAMRVPALAVCSTEPSIGDVGDLRGRRIGIGEHNGLLHLVMLALLRRVGMSAGDVEFVTIGSNTQVLRAVLAKDVDAGPCGVAGLGNAGLRVLRGGDLWRVLPQFTYQLAYASRDALRVRPAAIARCIAAYTLLFRFISTAASHDAYLAARERGGGDPAEAEQVWRFIQRVQPYARMPDLSGPHVDYLQRLNIAAGLQHRVMPFAHLADLGPARAAQLMLR